MTMYKTCSRCGQVHPYGKKCYANSRNYYQSDPKIRAFRNSAEWKSKAEEIKERDKYLCRMCYEKGIFNYKGLSVHHITPLVEDWSRRLENDNLITVCAECHKECEIGKIKREYQYEVLKNER